MKLEEVSTVCCGFCFICLKAFVTTSGYKHFIESGLVLVTLVLAFAISHNLPLNHSEIFRTWDPGLWACLLLPSVANGVESEDRCLMHTLVLSTVMIYLWRAGVTLTKSWLGIALVVYICLTGDLVFHKPTDAMIVTACCVGYIYMMNNLPAWLMKSFTFGEASVIVQLYVCQIFREIRTVLTENQTEPLEKAEIVVFLGLHIALLLVWILSRTQCPPLVLWPVMVVIGTVYLALTCLKYLSTRDVEKLLYGVLLTSRSAVLLCWWSLWLLSSILLVRFHGNKHSSIAFQKPSHSVENVGEEIYSEKCVDTELTSEEMGNEEKYKQIHSTDPATEISYNSSKYNARKKSRNKPTESADAISVRKYFHLAMICVYVPGLILCPNLLHLASILVAALFIFLEIIRTLNVEPFAPMLNTYLGVFLDEQDTGGLILTPLYLLFGCSLPIWWNYKVQKPPCSLSMYSGLISVGVGDAAASVIGRKYGKHKWPGSKKSLEGTAAAIISQIIAIQMLSFINISGAVVSMETVFCVVLISLLEAFTNQIDNLVVPLFAWVLLATIEPTY